MNLRAWQEFFDFLRNPRLPDERVPFGRPAVTQVGALLLLDWAIVLIFEVIGRAIESAGFKLPHPILDDWTPAQVILLAVVLGPPLEELIFRAGLSSERRTLILFVAPWLLVAVLLAARFLIGPLEMRTILILSLGWLVSTMAMVAYHWRDRSVSDRFRRRFPYVFWLTSGLFGFLHVFNYGDDPLNVAALFLVIPIFTGGLIFGYVRVKYGMWSNITQHVTHNAVAVAVFYAWPELLI